MSVIVIELYEALRAAGVEEAPAKAAAQAVLAWDGPDGLGDQGRHRGTQSRPESGSTLRDGRADRDLRRPGGHAQAVRVMDLKEFVIGETFWTGGGQFRCTDIGTRVVVAIKFGPQEICQSELVEGVMQMITRIDDDPVGSTGRRTRSRSTSLTSTTRKGASARRLSCRHDVGRR